MILPKTVLLRAVKNPAYKKASISFWLFLKIKYEMTAVETWQSVNGRYSIEIKNKNKFVETAQKIPGPKPNAAVIKNVKTESM